MVTVVERSSVSLWSTRVILGCSILLSFPVGLILAALNYRTMSAVAGTYADKARTYTILAVVGTLVYIVATNFLADAGLSWVTFLINIAVGFLVRNDMDEQMSNLEARQGGAIVETASPWSAIGVGLLFSVGLLALFYVLAGA